MEKKKAKLNHIHMVTNKYFLLFIEDEEMKVNICKFSLDDLNIWKDVAKETELLLFVN